MKYEHFKDKGENVQSSPCSNKEVVYIVVYVEWKLEIDSELVCQFSILYNLKGRRYCRERILLVRPVVCCNQEDFWCSSHLTLQQGILYERVPCTSGIMYFALGVLVIFLSNFGTIYKPEIFFRISHLGPDHRMIEKYLLYLRKNICELT